MIRQWIRAARAEKSDDPFAKEEARALCVLLGATPQATLRETLVRCRQKAAGMQLDFGNSKRDLEVARKQRDARAEMIDQLSSRLANIRELMQSWPDSEHKRELFNAIVEDL